MSAVYCPGKVGDAGFPDVNSSVLIVERVLVLAVAEGGCSFLSSL